MGLKNWLDEKAGNLSYTDVKLGRLAAAAFALMVAKLWAPILILDWYWYLIIAVLALIKPVITLIKKKKQPT
jgi:hypothetical protein